MYPCLKTGACHSPVASCVDTQLIEAATIRCMTRAPGGTPQRARERYATGVYGVGSSHSTMLTLTSIEAERLVSSPRRACTLESSPWGAIIRGGRCV